MHTALVQFADKGGYYMHFSLQDIIYLALLTENGSSIWYNPQLTI